MEWSVLYTRVPTTLKNRIDKHAAADRRTAAKWVELALEDYCDTLDAIDNPADKDKK